MALLLTGMISMLGVTLYRLIRYLRNTKETSESCKAITELDLNSTLVRIQPFVLALLDALVETHLLNKRTNTQCQTHIDMFREKCLICVELTSF